MISDFADILVRSDLGDYALGRRLVRNIAYTRLPEQTRLLKLEAAKKLGYLIAIRA